MTSQTFADHHDQLLQLSKTILETVSQGSPDSMQALSAQRIALSRLVNDHCGEEIKIVNSRAPALRSDPEKTALVRRFHDELLAWRGDLMECNANWPQRKVANDPRGFLTIFADLAKRLQARVQWEEQVFYPAVMGQTVCR